MENKIYLSLPISGYDIEERRATAQRMEDALLEEGWAVANPLKNGLPADAGTHAHMKRDFELLLQCDAILMMAGFLHSAGCKVEFDVATACGMHVYFEECHGLCNVKFK